VTKLNLISQDVHQNDWVVRPIAAPERVGAQEVRWPHEKSSGEFVAHKFLGYYGEIHQAHVNGDIGGANRIGREAYNAEVGLTHFP
jgi:hypothetical protein